MNYDLLLTDIEVVFSLSTTGIFGDDEEFDESADGYCFVDSRQPGGITPLLADDDTNRNFYIPATFEDLDLYFERTNNVDSNAVVGSVTLNYTLMAIVLMVTFSMQISLAVSFTSENETILNHPVANRPSTGLLSSNRLCKGSHNAVAAYPGPS